MATTIAPANTTTPELIGRCNPDEKLWWVFFLSSVFTLFGGLFLVLFGKLVVLIHKKISHRNNHDMKKVSDSNRAKDKEIEKQGDIGWVTSAKDWAGELISGQTTSGRILVS